MDICFKIILDALDEAAAAAAAAAVANGEGTHPVRLKPTGSGSK